jgi:hypothetical protein
MGALCSIKAGTSRIGFVHRSVSPLDHNGEATKDRMARRTTDGTPAIQANFRSLLVQYDAIGFLRVSG